MKDDENLFGFASDADKWAGWLSNAFSPNNPQFLSLLRVLGEQLGVQLGDAVVCDLRTVVNSFAKLSIDVGDFLTNTANDAIAAKIVHQELMGKFNDLPELNFGGASAFFSGLDVLIGRPHVNLREAVEREHASDEKISTANYHVTTTPRLEWALVFGTQQVRNELIPQGSLDGGWLQEGDEKILQPRREWKDLTELRKDAHNLINGARETSCMNQRVGEDDIQEIGLLEEEIGCLRLYTGPMFRQYNTLLRLRGEIAHEYEVSQRAVKWARARSSRRSALVMLDPHLFTNEVDCTIAKRAIVWSWLHSKYGEAWLQEEQTVSSTLHELLQLLKPCEDGVPNRVKMDAARLVFPAPVFKDNISNQPADIAELQTIIWARQQFVTASGNLNWTTLIPQLGPNFPTEASVKDATESLTKSMKFVALCDHFADRLFELTSQQQFSDHQAFSWVPVLQDSYTTTIHLIASGMVKLARLQPSVRLFRGIGANKRIPSSFETPDDKFNTLGGVEFAFMSCSQDRKIALQYSSGGYLLELATGITTRGADLSWLSFYPEEKEVCLPPCTALEVQKKSRIVEGIVVVDLVVIANPAAATIETFLQQRKNVVLELAGIQQDITQKAGKNVEELRQYCDKLTSNQYFWFNDAQHFTDALKGVLDISRVYQDFGTEDDVLLKFASDFRSEHVLELLLARNFDPLSPCQAILYPQMPLLEYCSRYFSKGYETIITHSFRTLTLNFSSVDENGKDLVQLTKSSRRVLEMLEIQFEEKHAIYVQQIMEFMQENPFRLLKELRITSRDLTQDHAKTLGLFLADKTKCPQLEQVTLPQDCPVTAELAVGLSRHARKLCRLSPSTPVQDWLHSQSPKRTFKVASTHQFDMMVIGLNLDALDELTLRSASQINLEAVALGFEALHQTSKSPLAHLKVEGSERFGQPSVMAPLCKLQHLKSLVFTNPMSTELADFLGTVLLDPSSWPELEALTIGTNIATECLAAGLARRKRKLTLPMLNWNKPDWKTVKELHSQAHPALYWLWTGLHSDSIAKLKVQILQREHLDALIFGLQQLAKGSGATLTELDVCGVVSWVDVCEKLIPPLVLLASLRLEDEGIVVKDESLTSLRTLNRLKRLELKVKMSQHLADSLGTVLLDPSSWPKLETLIIGTNIASERLAAGLARRKQKLTLPMLNWNKTDSETVKELHSRAHPPLYWLWTGLHLDSIAKLKVQILQREHLDALIFGVQELVKTSAPALTELDVCGVVSWVDVCEKLIPPLVLLVSLRLEDEGIVVKDESLTSLRTLNRLKRLELKVKMSQHLADSLGDLLESTNCPQLTCVIFDDSNIMTTRLASGLAKRTHAICGSQLSSNVVGWLNQDPRPSELQITEMNLKNLDCLWIGIHLDSLRTLDLHTALSPNSLGLLAVGQASQSRELNLTDLDLSASRRGLSISDISQLFLLLTKLTALDLSSNNLGPNLGSIFKGLGQLSSLAILDLSVNALGDEGAICFADPLRGLKNLTALDLSANAIGVKGAEAVAPAILGLSNLTALNLAENKLGDQGMLHLAQTLPSQLRILNFQNNLIGDGVEYLALRLRTLKSLTALNLSWNFIDAQGAQHLSQSIGSSLKKLAALDLSHNTIGVQGTASLSVALCSLSSLTSLDISANKLDT